MIVQKAEPGRSYSLKEIDCNCNDCEFMGRDNERLNAHKLSYAGTGKMDKLQFGHCWKLNKPVSFIPMTCQIETQGCFELRESKKSTHNLPKSDLQIEFNGAFESEIAHALTANNIRFIHESESNGLNQRLDFYLPDFDIFIEVKQYYTDRCSKQLSAHKNVIFIQGELAAKSFIKLINKDNAE